MQPELETPERPAEADAEARFAAQPEAVESAARTESAEPAAQTGFGLTMQPELVDTGKLQRDLEALLFVASEALSIKQLARITGAEQPAITLALQKIDEDFAHRGVVLREIAGGYRFASAPAAREAVEAYLMPPKSNLSPAALETLAIAAYMQPVTRGDIEGIRGVNADSVIATLVDRRFLIESGRKDVPGRPMLYKTTPEFLETFGLRSLEELPAIDVDANAPVELALPIPTALADPDSYGTVADGDPAVEETTAQEQSVLEDEPSAASGARREPVTGADRDDNDHDTPGEASAQAEPADLAPAETAVAAPETEPQPSAV